MSVINTNERPAWVIKDQDGNYVRSGSIKKIDKHTWAYIAHKEFSECCRADTFKEQAEETLLQLNKINVIAGFDIAFHLEYIDLNIIAIVNNKLDPSDNLVLNEKSTTLKFPKSVAVSLTEAI